MSAGIRFCMYNPFCSVSTLREGSQPRAGMTGQDQILPVQHEQSRDGLQTGQREYAEFSRKEGGKQQTAEERCKF